MQTPRLSQAPPAPAAEARALLSRSGDPIPADASVDAVSTRVMDLFRRTGAEDVFECLVRLTSGQLLQRVRGKARFLGPSMDPQEILQDVIINIYRYPDRFDARRPGAFRAWSSTIVDNTIRRHLRKNAANDVVLRPSEILAEHPDLSRPDPGQQVIEGEAYDIAVCAYKLFLFLYLEAFRSLSERERFVLQMVEVRRTRYAELAAMLGIRPEALKMVVFRARRRIADRIGGMLPGPRPSRRRPPQKPSKAHLLMAS